MSAMPFKLKESDHKHGMLKVNLYVNGDISIAFANGKSKDESYHPYMPSYFYIHGGKNTNTDPVTGNFYSKLVDPIGRILRLGKSKEYSINTTHSIYAYDHEDCSAIIFICSENSI